MSSSILSCTRVVARPRRCAEAGTWIATACMLATDSKPKERSVMATSTSMRVKPAGNDYGIVVTYA
jgi:hypothetical protein